MDTLYTIYRTDNKTNGRYYIGVHKTTDPMDDYLGSGKIFKRAVAKYGKDCFEKEVLFATRVPSLAFAVEFGMVEKHRNDPLCYNIRQGGSGGFDYINRSGLNGNLFVTEESVKKRQATRRKTFETDPVFRRRMVDCAIAAQKFVDPGVREESRKKAVESWTGSHHTEEIKKFLSDKTKGEGNPHYGTRWMYRGEEARFVESDRIEEFLCQGWGFGRKYASPKEEKEPRKTLVSEAPPGMTWCSLHKQYLPVEQFHKDSKQKSGYQKRCIDCRKKKRKVSSPKRED